MSDASKAAFGGEAILPIFSSQKIPTGAPVMTSTSFIASSRFYIEWWCCHLVYYNIFRLILEIFSGSLSRCGGFLINFGIIKMQAPRDNTAMAPTP